jgi:histidinol-phosphate/aromatic aminotransferase/cobyric acid decarboxylase-like protein
MKSASYLLEIIRSPQTLRIGCKNEPTGTVRDVAALFGPCVRDVKEDIIIVDEAYLEFAPDLVQRSATGLTPAGKDVVMFGTFGTNIRRGWQGCGVRYCSRGGRPLQ